MKPNVLAIVPALIPSVYLGVVKPLADLKKRGVIDFKIIYSELYSKKMLRNTDLVVFCRNTNISDLSVLNDLIQLDIPYIYEIDDNFFRIPTNSALGRFHKDPYRIKILSRIIENASLVRVYSNNMREECEQFSDKVDMFNLYFNFDLIKNVNVDEHSGVVRIIYSTSRKQDDQQEIFVDALLRIARKFSNKVEIYFWGAEINNKEVDSLDNVYHLKPLYNYDQFIKKFKSMNFDIGLAPIFGDRFFNSKTNNKYREYGACQISGIYSNEDLYRGYINDGVNGILVNNDEESWYSAIERLVDDSDYRESITGNAYKDVLENYTYDDFCKHWESAVLKACKERKGYTFSYPEFTSILPLTLVVDLDSNKNVMLAYLGTKYLIESGFMNIKLLSDVQLFSASIDYVSFDDCLCNNLLVFTSSSKVMADVAKKVEASELGLKAIIVGLEGQVGVSNDNIALLECEEVTGCIGESDECYGIYNDYESNFYYKMISCIEGIGFSQVSRSRFFYRRFRKKVSNLKSVIIAVARKYMRFTPIKNRIWMYIEMIKVNYFE